MTVEIKENPTLIKDVLKLELTKNPLLVPEYGVTFQPLSQEHLAAFAANYRQAFERGDFFATRYSDPESQIFSRDWLSGEIANPNHIWTVFMREGEFIGATGLFYEDGGITSDETQLDVKGRGFGTMKHFLRRIVPQLDNLEVDIAADFLLTPQSKSLRTTLQGELGMAALGIHPHELVHPKDSGHASLISGRKFHHLRFQTAIIVPQLTELYAIVQKQLALPPAQIVPVGQKIESKPRFTKDYQEVLVRATDPETQLAALAAGFRPIKFDPRLHTFTMATFPKEKLNLSFIAQENIPANTKLVAYLEKLYDVGVKNDERI